MMGFFPLKFSPFPGQRHVSLGWVMWGKNRRQGSEGWGDVGEQKVVLINCVSPLIYNIKGFCKDLKDCHRISQIREV